MQVRTDHRYLILGISNKAACGLTKELVKKLDSYPASFLTACFFLN